MTKKLDSLGIDPDILLKNQQELFEKARNAMEAQKVESNAVPPTK
jgi:hypothetical protein